MTESQGLRHHCRNPRCRKKLKEPVENLHKAFCTSGCHFSFYRPRSSDAIARKDVQSIGEILEKGGTQR
jgi:hypothetical protein